MSNKALSASALLYKFAKVVGVRTTCWTPTFFFEAEREVLTS